MACPDCDLTVSRVVVLQDPERKKWYSYHLPDEAAQFLSMTDEDFLATLSPGEIADFAAQQEEKGE